MFGTDLTLVASAQIEYDRPLGPDGSRFLFWEILAQSSVQSATLLVAASDTILPASLAIEDGVFQIFSWRDIYLRPVGEAKITIATTVEFDDNLGPKIRFYSHSHAVQIPDPATMEIIFDRWFTLGSDTNTDAVRVAGDVGDATFERDVYARNFIGSFIGDVTDTTPTELSFDDLLDVSITSLGDNELPMSFNGEWINRTLAEAGIASSTDLSTHTSNTSNPHNTSYSNIAGSPSDDITAGNFIDWVGNTLNVDPNDGVNPSELEDTFSTNGLLRRTSGSVYDTISDNSGNWNTAYSWGDHSIQGYITDANDSVQGSELDGVFSTTGLLKRTGSASYTTISDNSGNWNTAYGWGDHAGLYLPLSGGTMGGSINMGNNNIDMGSTRTGDIVNLDQIQSAGGVVYIDMSAPGGGIFLNAQNQSALTLEPDGDAIINGTLFTINAPTLAGSISAASLKGTVYYSSDDSQGIDTVIDLSTASTITVKDGLITEVN